jgi:hypothetical protein
MAYGLLLAIDFRSKLRAYLGDIFFFDDVDFGNKWCHKTVVL